MRRAASLALVATSALYVTTVEHASAGPLHLFPSQETTRPRAGAEFQAQGIRECLGYFAYGSKGRTLRAENCPSDPARGAYSNAPRASRCVPNRGQR
jgi:hypothetical protein